MSYEVDSLKFTTGIVQMSVAGLVYFGNKYYFQVEMIGYFAIVLFCIGMLVAGLKYQTIISPTCKIVKITRGLFFLVFTREYSSADISQIQVIKKIRRGTDQNGIGPTRRNVLITTYYTQLLLKNSRAIVINYDKDKNMMETYASKAGKALNVPVEVNIG